MRWLYYINLLYHEAESIQKFSKFSLQVFSQLSENFLESFLCNLPENVGRFAQKTFQKVGKKFFAKEENTCGISPPKKLEKSWIYSKYSYAPEKLFTKNFFVLYTKPESINEF